jgi:hypothetical protein
MSSGVPTALSWITYGNATQDEAHCRVDFHRRHACCDPYDGFPMRIPADCNQHVEQRHADPAAGQEPGKPDAAPWTWSWMQWNGGCHAVRAMAPWGPAAAMRLAPGFRCALGTRRLQHSRAIDAPIPVSLRLRGGGALGASRAYAKSCGQPGRDQHLAVGTSGG